MRRAIFLVVVAAMFAAALMGDISEASAQDRYVWTNARGRTRIIPINWKPDSIIPYKRYTVAIAPLQLINNGFKFDFEGELRHRQGEWLQTSLIAYIAPPRERRYSYYYGRSDGNNRWTYNSGGDSYSKMWGVGTSLLFKKMLHRRGWYFSTGIKFEFYSVEANRWGMYPFTEDGLTFYEEGIKRHKQLYFKPTLQFNIGKHFAVSRRCFFDIYVGVSYSYSFYDRKNAIVRGSGNYYYHPYEEFSSMDGFAYRGFSPNLGVRFGVLLWDRDDR